MGLSSSQGRLLMLTSRLSDIELQQILLSQRQNRLAWDQEKIAKTYSEAMKDDGKYICVPFKIDAITRMMCGGRCDDNDKENVKCKLEKFMYPLTLFKDSVTTRLDGHRLSWLSSSIS